ncbi:MAG: beta-lactamase family protein [Clostridia bacterium]|nr:beta-lactamase family protein [Clostridia bacterium]
MDFTPVKSVMDDITAQNIPGCDIAIMKDNKLVFRYSAGYSDLENKTPIKGDELYYLFSATKPITGAAAVLLAEEGKIRFDDEVGKYIPSFNNIMVNVDNGDGTYTRVPAKRPVRIIDLLSMTAGLDYNLASPDLHALMKRTDGRCPTVDVANMLGERGLFFHPGEKFSYSLCLDVMGAVIEVASGEKFGEYLKKRFFEPLGMSHTTFDITPELKKQIATLYIFDNEQKKPIIKKNGNVFIFGSEYESGGAGLVSTVDDYIKFTNMLTNLGVSADGTRIMSEESVNFMRKNQLTEEQMNMFWSGWKYLRGFGYGCGVRTALVPELVYGHFAPGEFGWCGAAGAMVIADPAEGISVYYAQHMQNSFEWVVHPKLRKAVYDSFGLI